MRLLADECCEAPLIAVLRTAGHDVRYISEEQSGLSDAQVLNLAAADGRILLTRDKDFGDLVVRMRMSAPGVILLRIGARSTPSNLERVLRLFETHEQRFLGHYAVIQENRIRFRPLPTNPKAPASGT